MRIKVDFSEFFTDERKLSVVNVNTTEAKLVKDVLLKIIRMFKLPVCSETKRRSSRGKTSEEKPEYGLFEEGFYVPPEETSTVLQDVGILKFQALGNASDINKGKGKKKKIKQEILEIDDVLQEESSDENSSRKKKTRLHTEEEDVKTTKITRKRRREQIDSAQEEEEEIDDTKVLKKKSSKKFKRIELVKDEEPVLEEPKRPKRKSRHQLETDNEDIQFTVKKDMKRETASITSTEEIKDSSSKSNKKSKSMKCEVGHSVSIQDEKDQSDESQVIKKKRKTRSEVESCVPLIIKDEIPDEGQAQQEVSTSNVIHIGSDESSKGSVSGSTENTSNEEINANGSIDSQKPKKRKKRRPKRSRKYLDKDGCVTRGNNSNTVENPAVAVPCSTSQGFDTSRSVSSSKSKLHIFFDSDNENSQSVSQSGTCDDIKIVRQSPETRKQRMSKASPYKQGDQSVSERQAVIDVEDEVETNDPISSTPAHFSFDSLRERNLRERPDPYVLLRRLCKEQTLTVVNVSSVKKTIKSVSAQIQSTQEPVIRGPPCPAEETTEVDDRARKVFRNLVALQHSSIPVVINAEREIDPISLDDEESVSANVVLQEASKEVEVPSQSSSTLIEFQEIIPDSQEVQYLPSTSGNQEEDNSDTETIPYIPGPASRSSQGPRPFLGIGRFLSSLKNINTNENETPTKNSPKDIKKQKKSTSTKDSDITSTIEEVLLPDVDEDKEDDEKISKENSPTIGKSDNLHTLQETITKSLNKGIIEEVFLPDADEDKQTDEKISKENSPAISESEDLKTVQETITESSNKGLLDEIKTEKCEEEEGDQTFMKYPVMKVLPRPGEYLAIKILNLDKNLKPVYSKYISVKVLGVTGLSVKLKTVHNVKKRKDPLISKQSNVEEVDLTLEEEEEEVDLTKEEEEDVLELDWRDIYEPRHLFP